MTLVSLYDVIVHCRHGRHGRGGHGGGMEIDARRWETFHLFIVTSGREDGLMRVG